MPNKSVLIVLSFLTAFMLLMVFSCGGSPTQKAREFVDAGMYSEAASLLREHIEEEPKDADAHFLLGSILLLVGEGSEADESFQRAIRLDEGYKEKVVRAYYDGGSSLIGQSTFSSVGRGLEYLRVATTEDKTFLKQASKLCRDQGVQLSESDPRTSRVLLREALGYNPDLRGDEEFFYCLYITAADGQMSRNQACEEFVGRFPTGDRLADVYYQLGDYQYNLADYKQARHYFALAGETAGVGELSGQLQSRLRDIDEIEANRTQAEIDRIRTVKLAEIETDREIARIEAEKAVQLKQIEVQRAQEEQRLATQQAELQKQQELSEQRQKLAQAEVAQALLGRWYFDKPPCNDRMNVPKFSGAYFEFEKVAPDGSFAGSQICPAWPDWTTSFHGTLRGTTFELFLTLKDPASGVYVQQTFTGTIAHASKSMSGGATGDSGWVLRQGWSARKR